MDRSEYQKEYAEVHKDELKAYRKDYYQRTKETDDCHFRQLKSAAGRRKLQVGITFEQYVELTKPNECYYCKGILTACGYNIDRLDHMKGYLLGNVVPCCWDCKRGRELLKEPDLDTQEPSNSYERFWRI